MTTHDRSTRLGAPEPSLGAITTTCSHGSMVIRIVGEFDDCLAYSPHGDAALLAAVHATGDVRVDLSRVAFMDSRAIGWLIRLRNAITTTPGRCVLVTDASPRAARTLQLTGMTRVFGWNTCS